jgi:hypothetical protein
MICPGIYLAWVTDQTTKGTILLLIIQLWERYNMINLEIVVAKQRVDMSYKALQDAWKALQDAQLQHALDLEEFDKCFI